MNDPSKRPRDPSQLAKLIVDIATGEAAPEAPGTAKDPSAVALGRKGGKARADKLSEKQRRQIAKQAAKARWAKKTT